MKRLNYALLSCLGIFVILGVAALPAYAQNQTTEQLKLTKQLDVTDNKVDNKVDSNKPAEELPAPEKIETAQDDALNFSETDLWNRIRGGYAIPNLENALVTQQTNWYSNRIDYLMRIIQRGSRYLYHVVDALDKPRIPPHLALLPFI